MDCDKCGYELAEEVIQTVWEYREDNRGKEQVVLGYTCQNCGHRERY